MNQFAAEFNAELNVMVQSALNLFSFLLIFRKFHLYCIFNTVVLSSLDCSRAEAASESNPHLIALRGVAASK